MATDARNLESNRQQLLDENEEQNQFEFDRKEKQRRQEMKRQREMLRQQEAQRQQLQHQQRPQQQQQDWGRQR